MPASTLTPDYIDALERALGAVVRRIQGEVALLRERSDALVAQAAARLAETEARIAELERRIEARAAALRDGVDGRDGADGVNGADGAPGPAGPPGASGRDASVDDMRRVAEDVLPALVRAAVEAAVAAVPPARDGVDGKDAPPVEPEQIAAAVADYLAANPPPAGKDGPPGPTGPAGPPGRLPVAKAWADKVHYEGDVVRHLGATWQAQRDTGHAPPHADWACLAQAGADGAEGPIGRGLEVRGTWAASEVYAHLDLVALGGSSFVARQDDPGPCPGPGWQLVASAGGRGRQGDRGERGPAGPRVIALRVDDEGCQTLTNDDGSTVECDLYPILSRLG